MLTPMLYRAVSPPRGPYARHAVAKMNYIAQAVASTLALSVCSMAAAQEAAKPEELQRVQVTANKRKEPIQQVPMSVKAITGDQLEERGVSSLEEALPGEPGVVINKGATAVSRNIAIRGVTDTGFSLTQSTVAIYIDELPTSVVQASGNVDLALYDIDKIILIRGPRSTLYGSAALGGTIKIETRNPSLTAMEGSARLGLSKTQGASDWNQELVASVSTPLVKDQMAVGITAYRNKQAGYVDHPTLGKDVNEVTTEGVRVALFGQITSQWSVSGRIYSQDIKAGNGSLFLPGTDFQAKPTAILEPWSDKLSAGSVALKYSGSAFEFVSATSYFDKTAKYDADNTGFFGPFGPGFGLPANQIYRTIGEFDSKVFAQEFRFLSPDVKTGLTWSAGLFYSTEKTINNGETPVPVIGNFFGSASSTDRKQSAAFGELGYKFDNGLTVNAGLRYTKYTSDDSNTLIQFGFPSPAVARLSEKPVTPYVSVSYAVGRDIYYAQASKGFRMGKTNFPLFVPPGLNFTQPAFAGSDSLWTYEAGAKTSWLANRVNLNVAVYTTRWTDPQLTVFAPTGFSYVDSLGRRNPGAGIDVNGFEIDLAARPISGLLVSAGVGYVDSRINKNVIGLDTVTDPATFAVQERVTPKGTRVVGIPQITANATARYSFAVGNLPAFVGGSVQRVGSYNSDFRTSPGANRVLGGYTALDLRGGVDIRDLSLTMFINNATNARPYVFQSSLPPETVGSIRPRTTGVVATYRF